MTLHRTLMRTFAAPLGLPVALLASLLTGVAGPAPARAQDYGVGISATAPTIPAQAWAAYREKFLAPDGRIVDTGNGDISHSEGQGYGLLLSVAADDRDLLRHGPSDTRAVRSGPCPSARCPFF